MVATPIRAPWLQHGGTVLGRVRGRHFPPPWSVDAENAACFIVRDHDGKSLAYVYFEEEPGRRAAAKLLTNFWQN